MHAAPPVRVSLDRDRAWVVAVTVLAAAAAANLAAWVAAWGESNPGLMLATALVAAALGARLGWLAARRGLPPGELGWDGTRWQWQASGAAAIDGEVEVAIDLDRWLLLRFVAAASSRGCWIAASRAGAPAQWSALRSALYSPRPAESPSPAPSSND